jgi:dipeptidase E
VTMRVLLHSGGPLGPEGRAEVRRFLQAPGGALPRVTFITAASLGDEALYFERVRAGLAPPPPEGAGLDVIHLRWRHDPLATLAAADAVFMGGGNTYALLQRLRETGLLDAIRDRVRAGMPYVGASAGSNVAGPTILTTNDWNVVALDRFDALGLVGFSETRDDRIREYHVVNANPVVGLEEGALVSVIDGTSTALGTARIKLFRRGTEPAWFSAGDRLPVA